MADFEDRIASWRRELSSAMEDRPDVVDELEDHLRQEVDSLTRAGNTPGEAWDAAVARLGDPHRLAREFSKSARTGWLPTRVAMAVLAGCALAVGVFLVVAVSGGRFGALLAAHVFAICTGYGATLALGFSAAAAIVAHATGTFGPRQADAFRHAGTRILAAALAFTFVGVVLGAIWLRAYRGHYWQWDSREVGGLCVLVWNGAALACIRRQPVAGMVAGVVGNAVVTAAWFAPALMEPSRPQAPVWYAPILAVFVMSQLMLALAASLLPAGWVRGRGASGQGTG